MSLKAITESAIELLEALIATPSFSGEEERTAELISDWLTDHGVKIRRSKNSVIAENNFSDPSKPYLLLNSHHDTVKPNNAYVKDPFKPEHSEGKLFGLGSNDAGGALVSLLATFLHFYDRDDLPFNLLMVASAEEETAGPNSLRGLLAELPPIELAIVGEPTQMQLAIAEKGLMVYDAVISGTPSHAAHPNDDNPIYKCIEVLSWFKQLNFERNSEMLGAVKTTVTQISAGKQHNVVPAAVNLVVDIRVTDAYTNEEIDAYFQANAPCQMTPRSFHLRSSGIEKSHPLVQAGIALGRETYGSPTLSDQAALSCKSMKMGPGDSLRSHQADEFICIHEIEEAIPLYIKLLESFFIQLKTKTL